MKNFPHQFNDLSKLYSALLAVKELIEEEIPLKDENFGELLTRKCIYTYRDKSLSIEEFLTLEQEKSPANRGYHTVARDTRRLFQLLGFLTVEKDKSGRLSPAAIQLILATSPEIKNRLWKNSFMQLGLEVNSEISHPYRILLKLVQCCPEIETKKLMLALEAKNDSVEEFERIMELSESSMEDIIESTGTSESMANNAVKILPGIAEQLGDIIRKGNITYPVSEIIITEDEITSEIASGSTNEQGILYSQFRAVTSDEIAKDPIFNKVSSVSIDLTEAIRIRQDRLAHHQKIVRQLGLLNEQNGFDLFEGKFDCLSTQNETALLFEVKTILDNSSDQEKQTVKGVGQLKYYKFSIVHKQMGHSQVKQFIVFSQKPTDELIEFCSAENISVVWYAGENFKIYNIVTTHDDIFEPIIFI